MKDSHEKFSLLTVGFHWIIAIGMIAMIAFGLYLEDLPRSPEKGELIGLHKSFGVIIFSLAVLRIIWRIKNGFPQSLSVLTNWQDKLAKATHWFLIIATVMMPISGMFMSIGGGYPIGVFGFELVAGSEQENESLSQIGHTIHGLVGKLLILFIALHIIGAVKHQFFEKDGTLSRMAGRRVKNATTQA